MYKRLYILLLLTSLHISNMIGGAIDLFLITRYYREQEVTVLRVLPTDSNITIKPEIKYKKNLSLPKISLTSIAQKICSTIGINHRSYKELFATLDSNNDRLILSCKKTDLCECIKKLYDFSTIQKDKEDIVLAIANAYYTGNNFSKNQVFIVLNKKELECTNSY